MIEIQLVIKGTKGDIIIKGSNIDEVLKEFELNKEKIRKVLGEVSRKRPTEREVTVATSTVQGRISSLKEVGFFDDIRTAEEVRDKLKMEGHPYSIDRISVALLRLVRKRKLRRLSEEKEKGKGKVYVYVNP